MRATALHGVPRPAHTQLAKARRRIGGPGGLLDLLHGHLGRDEDRVEACGDPSVDKLQRVG